MQLMKGVYRVDSPLRVPWSKRFHVFPYDFIIRIDRNLEKQIIHEHNQLQNLRWIFPFQLN